MSKEINENQEELLNDFISFSDSDLDDFINVDLTTTDFGPAGITINSSPPYFVNGEPLHGVWYDPNSNKLMTNIDGEVMELILGDRVLTSKKTSSDKMSLDDANKEELPGDPIDNRFDILDL